MKKSKFLCLIACLCFVSCGTDDPLSGGDGWLSQYYINAYIDTNEIINSSQIMESDMHVRIRLRGNFIHNNGGTTVKFQELGERYGDTNYNGLISEPSANAALADEFTAVEVVSDEDFDPEHSAGTSLADIITFISSSPYRFIRSGYQETYDWDKAPDEYRMLRLEQGPGSWPIEKPLTELTRADLTLLDTYANYLRFDSRPTLEREHNLTITFSNDEKTVTGTVKVTF